MTDKFKFKYVHTDNGKEYYFLDVPIVDDGCPHSEQWLRIYIHQDLDDDSKVTVELARIAGTGDRRREHSICRTYEVSLAQVADILYGAARLRTVTFLEPV